MKKGISYQYLLQHFMCSFFRTQSVVLVGSVIHLLGDVINIL